jgi:aerobic C4-dicarboxylate transport protein
VTQPASRAVTNFSGNAVATLSVGTWTSSIDSDRVKNVLDSDIPFDERTMIDDDEHEPTAKTPEGQPKAVRA